MLNKPPVCVSENPVQICVPFRDWRDSCSGIPSGGFYQRLNVFFPSRLVPQGARPRRRHPLHHPHPPSGTGHSPCSCPPRSFRPSPNPPPQYPCPPPSASTHACKRPPPRPASP